MNHLGQKHKSHSFLGQKRLSSSNIGNKVNPIPQNQIHRPKTTEFKNIANSIQNMYIPLGLSKSRLNKLTKTSGLEKR